MNQEIKVYDKDGDDRGLLGFAQDCSIDSYDSLEQVLEGDYLSVLVHLTEMEWKTLCTKLPPDRYALRFSTAKSFCPKPPEGSNRNCFCCLKPTKGDARITQEAFNSLVDCFKDESKLKQLHSTVPQELSGLISFLHPHRLNALHILLQACMVEWSHDPLHREDALKFLGCDLAPPSLAVKINRLGLLYRILTDQPWPDATLTDDTKKQLSKLAKTQLRQELGVDEGSSNATLAAIESLVDEVFSLSQEDDKLSWTTGEPAFKKLDELLRV